MLIVAHICLLGCVAGNACECEFRGVLQVQRALVLFREVRLHHNMYDLILLILSVLLLLIECVQSRCIVIACPV
jgi:hypothetical protein